MKAGLAFDKIIIFGFWGKDELCKAPYIVDARCAVPDGIAVLDRE